jgi:signal transduction histidine kinase
MLVAEAKSRHCRLITTIDATAPAFRARAPELRQVLLNLVINGLQAVPEGGTVELQASSHASGVCLCVVDDGQGIDSHLLERIFEPFVTSKLDSGGTGLGLSTSRQLVEAMGGTIRGCNREGGGACFEVVLPVDGLPALPAPLPRD